MMKFKQKPEEGVMSENLYKGFLDMIQFEINKITLLESGMTYFYELGLMNYKKFFKGLYDTCVKTKHCFIKQVTNNIEKIPECTIPAYTYEFKDKTTPFEMLAEMEDEFEEKLNKLIDIAFNDKDWKNFHYLLKKLDTIDHICCRALAAVENNADVLALCEQHITEK